MNNLKAWFKEMLHKPEVVSSIIAVIGIFLSVSCSVVITDSTNESQVEQQRIQAVREMKQAHYNQLIEAIIKFNVHKDDPTSPEALLAYEDLLIEANRVPLYASQDMVELIEELKKQDSVENITATEFYNVMREDLCSNSFSEFKDLKELCFIVPQR